MKLRITILAAFLLLSCGLTYAQATRPRSTRIITATAWPYGTCEVGDEWVDSSVSPAQAKHCLSAGLWSTLAVLSPDGTTSNTINGSSQTVQIALSGYRGVGVTVSGTWEGDLLPELSMDGGSTWISTRFYNSVSKIFTTVIDSPASLSIVVTGGTSHVRLRGANWVFGTATLAIRATEAENPISDGVAIRDGAGNNRSANVDASNRLAVSLGTSSVQVIASSGDAFDAPVGANSAPVRQIVTGGIYNSTKPTLTDQQSVAIQLDSKGNQQSVIRDAGGNDRGANVDTSNRLSVSLDGSSATLPISAASLPLPTSAATSTKQSDGSQKTQVVDGSGNVVGATSNALDINIKSGNPTTIAVTQGTATNLKTQAENYQGGAAVGSGNPLQVSLANTSANSTAVKVDNSAVTQPISASSLPLPTLAATSTKQSDGSQKTQIVDGSANVIGSTANALDVNIKSGNPTTITATQGTATNLKTQAESYQGGSAVSATNPLNAVQPGQVSTNNSTTSTLTSGSTFTGTSEDAIAFSEIRVSVIASHASATDGLSIQQSSDGTNWDITDTYTIPASTGKVYAVPRSARFVRVVYTNGGTNQTSFRLQTILNRVSSSLNSQRPGDAYTNETDVQQSSAFPMVFNGTTWDRARGDITNGLDVDVTRVPSNMSVNQTQVNGVAVDTGNGTAGSGTKRVTIASDNSPIQVGGQAAQAATAAGNPLLVGAYAESDAAGLDSTNVAEGDITRLKSDIEGRLLVVTAHPNRFSSGFSGVANSLTQIQAAPGAGLSIYITDINIQTTTTTSGTYAFQSGTGSNCGTSTTAVFPSSGTSNRFNAPITTSAMANIQFQTPIKLTTNHALCVIGVATNTVSGQVNGYIAP